MTEISELRVGDVVTVKHRFWKETVTGKVWEEDGALWLGGVNLTRWGDRGLFDIVELAERPEPPLYLNHDRDEPRQGDVVRYDPDGIPSAFASDLTWFYDGGGWRTIQGQGNRITGVMPRGVTLLVDGTTGLTVPPPEKTS